MTKNGRVKMIRNALRLSQQEFGAKIALAQSYVASIEAGKREVTPKIAKLICSVYGVNEGWLETGEGQMFESEGTLIELIGKKLPELDEVDRKILIEYIKLTPAQRKVIKSYIRSIIG